MFVALNLARCITLAGLVCSGYNFYKHGRSLTENIPVPWIQDLVARTDRMYGPYEIGMVMTNAALLLSMFILMILPLYRFGHMAKLLGSAIMVSNGIMYVIFYICVSVVSLIERKMPDFAEYEQQAGALHSSCADAESSSDPSCSDNLSTMSILAIAMRTMARFILFISSSASKLVNSEYASKIGIVPYQGALFNVHSVKYLIFSIIMIVSGFAVMRGLLLRAKVNGTQQSQAIRRAQAAKAALPKGGRAAAVSEKKQH